VEVDEFSSSLCEGAVIRQADLEGTGKERKLSICALIFMDFTEGLIKRSGGKTMGRAVDVRFGKMTGDEGAERVIIMAPDIISVRGSEEVRARDGTIEPGSKPTLSDSKE
jgi:hypothetical protein